MDDHIIRIQRQEWDWNDTPWQMTIDIKRLSFLAGRRVPDIYNGGKVNSYPISKAKKMLKLIVENGTDEDFEKCEKYFRENPKLYNWWKKYMEKRGANQ